jgi:hypothetical protein
MALSLGVHVGDKFYLNDVPVTVRSFAGYYAATVEVDGKTFDLSDEESVEIYPSVRASCGQPKSGKVERFRAVHQLIIDAPHSITIPPMQ